MARTAYDVAHPARPWGGKVAAYLWTKSIAAGALLVAALGVMSGQAAGNALAGIVAPVVALVFLALTSVLLVADLKRPERFLYLLTMPNPRSWLVRGAWILLAFGAAAAAWLVAGWTGHPGALQWLAAPVIVLAAAAAAYSALLFGQAEGRDFWQSPVTLPHLLVAAVAAGSAVLLLAAGPLGGGLGAPRGLRLVLFGALGLSLVLMAADLLGFHASQDAARAARTLTRGSLAGWLWSGVVVAGTVLPMLLLASPWPPGWALGALLSLGGLWLWEELWVRAGQSVPLS
jgi:formate-dependent nitrite reductase membrane component NrfD